MPQAALEISVAPSWLWISFPILVLVLLAIDLSLFGRAGHQMTRKKALYESAMWIGLALAFNAWFVWKFGDELGLEFLTGYLVEKSLSVDNLFIILMIFTSLRIPGEHQHRVLFFGVLGAILMRAFFILVGAQLLTKFHWILYIFGVVLILTAIKFLRDSDEKVGLEENKILKYLQRVLPSTKTMQGQNFFIRENGIKKATPLFLALIVIEITDLIFAVDSIPAIFAITQDGFVAFSSNIFAVLGLRALYFVLADWVGKLRYLKPGLAVILGFIGVKMLIMDFIKIPNWVSLVAISLVLVTAGLSSWYVAKLEEQRGES